MNEFEAGGRRIPKTPQVEGRIINAEPIMRRDLSPAA